jgi:hypothetical protein
MEFHDAIQRGCGWGECHLFAFQDDSGEVIAESPGSDESERGPDARKEKLLSYFGPEGQASRSCMYLYDFGDCWEHAVELLRTVDLPEQFHRRLVGGQRAFPPEDCGGVDGYRDCVRVAKGGKDPDELREWLPEGWHPDNFDLESRKRAFDADQAPTHIF